MTPTTPDTEELQERSQAGDRQARGALLQRAAPQAPPADGRPPPGPPPTGPAGPLRHRPRGPDRGRPPAGRLRPGSAPALLRLAAAARLGPAGRGPSPTHP